MASPRFRQLVNHHLHPPHRLRNRRRGQARRCPKVDLHWLPTFTIALSLAETHSLFLKLRLHQTGHRHNCQDRHCLDGKIDLLEKKRF